MIYSVVPICTVQQSDPVIPIYTHSLSYIIFLYFYPKRLNIVPSLYSKTSLFIHFKCNCLHLLILNSQSIPLYYIYFKTILRRGLSAIEYFQSGWQPTRIIHRVNTFCEYLFTGNKNTNWKRISASPCSLSNYLQQSRPWKQPKYPMTDEWIKKISHTHRHTHTHTHTHTQRNIIWP